MLPEVKTFRKKPLELTAVKWDGQAETATPLINWMHMDGGPTNVSYICMTVPCIGDAGGHTIQFRTNMKHVLRAGDYLMLNDRGEFRAMRPDLFEDLYTEVV